MISPTWIHRRPNPEASARLVRDARLSPLLADLLAIRGVTEAPEATRFLTPRLADLEDPFGLAGMSEAADAICGAMERGERVAVWGDYDVDGVTSTALLASFFRELDVPLRTFIPDRFQDGYGLSEPPLRVLAEEGIALVISVDCGITSTREIALARALGMGFIVVDHHEPGPTLPPATAIVNPLQPHCSYAFKKMAACGLTFHLLMALRSRMRARGWFGGERREPDLKRYLDLAALGTVADVVPLVGTNRVLTAAGLRVIAQAHRPGVRALAAVSGVRPEAVRASTIGFQMGPRINAAGRLSHAGTGLQMLMAERDADALALAREIDEENQRRREIQERMVQEAFLQVEQSGDPAQQRGFVLASESWHPGVSGIVASKVVERYHRPTVVIALDGELAKGSARSVAGFDLVRALGECAQTLEGFGGHAHAAGLTLRATSVQALRARFDAVARERLSEDALRPRLFLDGELSLRDLTFDVIDQIEQLAPFGMGNPRPVFAVRGARVTHAREVGRGHLRLEVEQDGAQHQGIGFGMAERAPVPGQRVDLAVHPERNEFRGEVRLQLRLRDWRPAA